MTKQAYVATNDDAGSFIMTGHTFGITPSGALVAYDEQGHAISGSANWTAFHIAGERAGATTEARMGVQLGDIIRDADDLAALPPGVLLEDATEDQILTLPDGFVRLVWSKRAHKPAAFYANYQEYFPLTVVGGQI